MDRERWSAEIKRISEDGRKRVIPIEFMEGMTLDEMVQFHEEIDEAVGIKQYDNREVVYAIHYNREQGIRMGWLKPDAEGLDWLTEVEKLNKEGD